MKTKPRYLKPKADLDLFRELQVSVHQRINQLPKSRLKRQKFKLFLLPAIYFSLYLLSLHQGNAIYAYYTICFLMGVMLVVIFHELIHELAHGNLFERKRYNRVALYIFDLLGANSYIWQKRHLTLHHQYPNVNGFDADIEQKGPIILFPEESSSKFSRYQHHYAFFLYPFFLLKWLSVRDFSDYFSRNRIVSSTITIPKIEYVKLFLFKAIYFFMMIGIPVLYSKYSILQSLLGLFILTLSGSLLAMVTLLTPHIHTGNTLPNPDKNGVLQNSWFRHQLETTSDIEPANWFIRHFMGNFNYHVAHHLFPGICHSYYPEVTEVIKKFALKNNLPYKSYSFSTAFRKHYELLRNNAVYIVNEKP